MNSAKSPSNAELKTAQSPQIRSDGELSIPYLLSALSTADAERREMVELMREAADYLDALEANMLRNDADMIMDRCEAPEDIALKLRQAADSAEGK